MPSARARRLATILATALLLTGLTACSGTDDDSPDGDMRTQEDDARTEADAVESGQPIVLEDWGLTFQLPTELDVTEIRVLELDDSTMMIGSSVLAESYDNSKCGGVALELGEFVTNRPRLHA